VIRLLNGTVGRAFTALLLYLAFLTLIGLVCLAVQLVTWLRCLCGWHHWVDLQRLSDKAVLVGCPWCNRVWSKRTGERQLVPWDLELRNFYRRKGRPC